MLKTIIKSNRFLVILIFLVALVSCDSKQIFDEYKSLESGSWEINTPITYKFTVTDTLAKKNLFINVRNNNDYEFSNLFLITKMSFPDGNVMQDTLEYDMADKKGAFLGEGFSEIKENKLLYKEQILFPTAGDYSVEVFQAMRKNEEIEGIQKLKGIIGVGFRIEKTK
ncbi:gliding motility lipoprotein GldH [Tenacibaculum sp. M341]|uniref:gliding motility lipoprotein GldH n=1 Tax=Tenacibaculum sp. M341 TaxID=2530339 RepID=UPI00104D001C|nr:gliding motility lipoprotein GldH [Tenacibaculum sp. M341]TCI92225.1 gliding motility lipoprotein GldH [Tenacibaculum sp. M341]